MLDSCSLLSTLQDMHACILKVSAAWCVLFSCLPPVGTHEAAPVVWLQMNHYACNSSIRQLECHFVAPALAPATTRCVVLFTSVIRLPQLKSEATGEAFPVLDRVDLYSRATQPGSEDSLCCVCTQLPAVYRLAGRFYRIWYTPPAVHAYCQLPGHFFLHPPLWAQTGGQQQD